jgi:hypothetical protein
MQLSYLGTAIDLFFTFPFFSNAQSDSFRGVGSHWCYLGLSPSIRTKVFCEKFRKCISPENRKTNGTIRKCSSRVMSVGSDNLKSFGGKFCVQPWWQKLTLTTYINTKLVKMVFWKTIISFKPCKDFNRHHQIWPLDYIRPLTGEKNFVTFHLGILLTFIIESNSSARDMIPKNFASSKTPAINVSNRTSGLVKWLSRSRSAPVASKVMCLNPSSSINRESDCHFSGGSSFLLHYIKMCSRSPKMIVMSQLMISSQFKT